MEYTPAEKEIIIQKYLQHYHIQASPEVIQQISTKVGSVPREIHNLCIKIRDYVITHKSSSQGQTTTLTSDLWEHFLQQSKIDE